MMPYKEPSQTLLTLLQRITDEGMPIKTLAAECDKELAGSDRARVNANPGELGVTTDQIAADLALARGWCPELIEVDYALKPDDAPEDAPAQDAQTTLRGLATLDWPEAYDPRHPSTRISLVEALPKTGRRHQIRRHLKHESHPIVGDATHGKGALNRWWAARIGLQRLWLHAHALELPHPRTGAPLSFCADWRKLGHVPEVQQWQQLLALPGWQATAHGLPDSCGLVLPLRAD
jgi:tRNA pseudouridine65 synthase